jgi:membrane protease YdiL (CAAX protease family)
MSRPSLAFGQATSLLLTVILVSIGVGLPIALIGHALDLDISGHPFIIGFINLAAFGYVIRQTIQRQGDDWSTAFPTKLTGLHHIVPMLLMLAGASILISELDNIAISLYPVPIDFATQMIDLATGGQGILATIFLANIVAPLTEELLFRGLILRGFLQTYSSRRSIFLSAALFALFHLNPWQAIGAFILGGVFGWWYVHTRSLLPCLLGHAAFNAIPVFYYGILGMPAPDPAALVEFQPLWFDALGALLFAGGSYTLYGMFRAERPVPSEAWILRARLFADLLLDYARDQYGDTETPLFVSQIDIHTRTLPPEESTLYITNTSRGAGRTANNLQFDGGLLRLLYGVTSVTSETAYAAAADDYLEYYLERLPLPSGYFPWGDHRGYDVVDEDVIDGYGEFKLAMPLWDAMWEIDAEAVVRQADALRKHIIDPARSPAFDRHYPPSQHPSCSASSAGAWIVLWSYVYVQTGDTRYLDWATEMDDYLWSLRDPQTDLLAAHPFDPAYPESQHNEDGLGSRTRSLEPMYGYAANLLRAHAILGGDPSIPFREHALAYIRSYTSRFDIDERGSFYATFDIATGKPLSDRIADGWQSTPQSRPDEPANDVIGLRAPISLAYAHLATGEPDLREAFDRFAPLFRLGSFLDLSQEPQPISAGLMAQAIGAWTNMYTATSEYAYLASAITLGQYATHHYVKDDWFVCGPPTDPRYRDPSVTGWETYSNRGGSADLALALLHLSTIAEGRPELLEDDPLCYF